MRFQRRIALQATLKKRGIRARVKSWQKLFVRQTAHGKRLLRELLAGPIVFTPEGRGYRFTANAGPLLASLVTDVVPVRSCEKGCSAENIDFVGVAA